MVNDLATKLARRLPKCSTFLLIASPQYNLGCRCDITSRTSRLLHAVKSRRAGESVWNQSVADVAFPLWLEAVHDSDNVTRLPEEFVKLADKFVPTLAESAAISVFCHECNATVSYVDVRDELVRETARTTDSVERWFCNNGHLLREQNHHTRLFLRIPKT